jgi:hypothetical protein
MREDLTTQQEDVINEEAIERRLERSYIKLIKNTRGYNWEFKIFEGTFKEQLDNLRVMALEQNNKLNEEIGG